MAAIRDGRPHRWVNSKTPGITAFITTTCLDFVHAFRRVEMRDLACRSILQDSRKYRAPLHAFVVMPHHFHALITCPEERTMSWLVQRLKSNLAELALPQLMDDELAEFQEQTGLNRRTFWKPGF